MLVCVFLAFLPVSSDAAEPNPQKEIRIGAKVAEQVEGRWERIVDPSVIARLSMISSRLVPFMNRELPYEIRCIREKSPNAFSLPGGIIYVTSGMLEFLHSDAEIAAVIAHELVHADRRHAMIQTARSQRLNVLTLGAIVLSGGSVAPIVLASLLQTAITNSYSIDLEREADSVALDVVAAAGYPPAAMVTVMEGLSEEQLKHPYVDPGVMMDHPETKERIAYLTKQIREKGLPLERKKALNALIPSISSENGYRVLSIDGAEVVRIPDSESSQRIIASMEEALDRSFQLELSPSEIQVVPIGGNGSDGNGEKTNRFGARRVLRVGPSVVIGDPLPGNATSLDAIRSNLNGVLLRAQTRHPMARYLY